MKASYKCINVIKHYEGFKSRPYLCPAGVTTIGYGTTIYPNGKKVTLRDNPINEAQAIGFLQNDLSQFEVDVTRLVKVLISHDLFDALVSFAYNLGSGALAGSTLLKVINTTPQGDAFNKRIATEFLKWVNAKVKGKPTRLAGLVARRTTESLLATSGLIKFFN